MTQAEKWAQYAYGAVLDVGLGPEARTTKALKANPDVYKHVVVEKDGEVIKKHADLLRGLTVIHGEWPHCYRELPFFGFDVVILDIFHTSQDIEMAHTVMKTKGVLCFSGANL